MAWTCPQYYQLQWEILSTNYLCEDLQSKIMLYTHHDMLWDALHLQAIVVRCIRAPGPGWPLRLVRGMIQPGRNITTGSASKIGCLWPSAMECHGQQLPEIYFADWAFAEALSIENCYAWVLLSAVWDQACNVSATKQYQSLFNTVLFSRHRVCVSAHQKS